MELTSAWTALASTDPWASTSLSWDLYQWTHGAKSNWNWWPSVETKNSEISSKTTTWMTKVSNRDITPRLLIFTGWNWGLSGRIFLSMRPIQLTRLEGSKFLKASLGRMNKSCKIIHRSNQTQRISHPIKIQHTAICHGLSKRRLKMLNTRLRLFKPRLKNQAWMKN